jgi:dienelactone hydrolase
MGENDARVTSTVPATIAAMEGRGKVYEPHIYPKATHSFVMFQDSGASAAAIEDAWPKAIAFLKKHIG